MRKYTMSLDDHQESVERLTKRIDRAIADRDEARAELARLHSERDELNAALELGQINCDAVYDDLKSERDAARADNARLTARVAELERENKSITVSFLSEHDRADDLASRETWHNAEIERLHAALDAQPAVLTPRNCDTCKRAAEAMREAAASFA